MTLGISTLTKMRKAMGSWSPPKSISENYLLIGRWVVVPVILIASWQFLTVVLGANMLPGPAETLVDIYRRFGQPTFVSSFFDTILGVSLGFLVSAVTGLFVGITLGRSDILSAIFGPFVLNLYALPKIILYPVFIFVFGLGLSQKAAFSSFFGFFPMAVITMNATKNIPQSYIQLSKSLKLNRLQSFRHVIFPYIIAHLVAGLRLAFSLSFLGVIISELFAANSGLGLLLREAMGQIKSQQIISIVTILLALGFAGNILFYKAQRTLEKRWNVSANAIEV